VIRRPGNCAPLLPLPYAPEHRLSKPLIYFRVPARFAFN